MRGKTCTYCKRWKPLNGFYKHRTGKFGRHADCMKCHGQNCKDIFAFGYQVWNKKRLMPRIKTLAKIKKEVKTWMDERSVMSQAMDALEVADHAKTDTEKVPLLVKALHLWIARVEELEKKLYPITEPVLPLSALPTTLLGLLDTCIREGTETFEYMEKLVGNTPAGEDREHYAGQSMAYDTSLRRLIRLRKDVKESIDGQDKEST